MTRRLLALAAFAVCFTAADTYVIVLALPDIMHGVGLSVDELQQGAPIVSGFLLGYVAMLPLIGRIADLRGRPPVLVAGLVLFAVGSFVTALSYGMPTIVTGRLIQGVGAGALVPATMALVADLYPVSRRAVPLGLVSAAQELGAVLGPLLGAAILAVTDWRMIFALNLVVAAALALSLRRLSGRSEGRRGFPDLIGLALLALTAGAAVLLTLKPAGLVRDLTWGELYVPRVGLSDWTTPLGLMVLAGLLLFLLRCLTARRPLVDLRRWGRDAWAADLPGAVLLAIALGGVVLAFSTTDPKVEVVSPLGAWYLAIAALSAVAFSVHLRRARNPLIPPGALLARPAWGGVLTSLLVGASLVAALVDIPLFARTTVYDDSQLLAALVLVRFLVALPVGAVAGGWLVRRQPPALVAAAGMLLAAAGFAWMSTWDVDSLRSATATIPLVLGGFGFGLALAPINHSVLAATPQEVHGVASAATVVARMIGMLVGISVLTAIGLRRYYAEQADLPTVQSVCHGSSRCDAFTDLLRDAGIAQEHTVFLGAAVVAVLAAGTALLLASPTRYGQRHG
ncbi:MFS transporter [Nocardioides sp. Kera G14]|uniref:MFS transporter n=1 Tax=Nocardioides sp. Kera G14 TaxID=2884264 RepID=UPI001D12C398|nr:MFS transporter [Nocardioides sp. Kera G14]UDY22382.1 MFS transporter [Nocardioides sp. Kera G14]